MAAPLMFALSTNPDVALIPPSAIGALTVTDAEPGKVVLSCGVGAEGIVRRETGRE